MLAINLWVKFSSFTEHNASLHDYAACTHAGAAARGPAVCLVFYQKETKNCYWRRYQQRGSYSPATHKNTCMCHLKDSAEAPGRAVRWCSRCHRMKGTDKNCSASSEGLKEVTPGHSAQEGPTACGVGRKGSATDGSCQSWDTGPRRCTAMEKEMPGASHHTQWELWSLSWRDSRGRGKERIKDDKRCLSNAYFQTSKNLPLGSRISQQIKNSKPLHYCWWERSTTQTVIYRCIHPLTQQSHFQESIPQNNWLKTTRREWEDKPQSRRQ